LAPNFTNLFGKGMSHSAQRWPKKIAGYMMRKSHIYMYIYIYKHIYIFHTHSCGMSHLWKIYHKRMKETCHTYEYVMLHISALTEKCIDIHTYHTYYMQMYIFMSSCMHTQQNMHVHTSRNTCNWYSCLFA